MNSLQRSENFICEAELTPADPVNGTGAGALTVGAPSTALALVPAEAAGLLKRMFSDPSLLETSERAELAAQLRACVRANPQVAELRVLFGMALCVNLEVPDAIEELREAVSLAPDSFIAQLKMGELWMRLRVMDKAEEHTHAAGLVAANLAQSELARRQGAAIRAMKREGIERNVGGYMSPWFALTRAARRLWKRSPQKSDAMVAVDVR